MENAWRIALDGTQSNGEFEQRQSLSEPTQLLSESLDIDERRSGNLIRRKRRRRRADITLWCIHSPNNGKTLRVQTELLSLISLNNRRALQKGNAKDYDN